MPRPPKCRRVAFIPEVTYFKPAGMPLRFLDEVCLAIEEVESIRLKDLENLEQEECAQSMNISRPTFQRILASARQKLADALLHGKVIHIEGGKFEMALRRFKCNAGHEWDVPFEIMVKAPPQLCPTCSTSSIMPLWPLGVVEARGGWGRCRRGRRGW